MQASGEPNPFNDLLLDAKFKCCQQINRGFGEFKTLDALAKVSTSWRNAVRAYAATIESATCYKPEFLPELSQRLTGLKTLPLYKGEMRVWELAELKSCTSLTKLTLDGDAASSSPESVAASQLFPPLDLMQLPTSLESLGLQSMKLQPSSVSSFQAAAMRSLSWQWMRDSPTVQRNLLHQLPHLRELRLQEDFENLTDVLQNLSEMLPQLTSLHLYLHDMDCLEPQGMNAAGLRELHVAVTSIDSVWLESLLSDLQILSFLSINTWNQHEPAPHVVWSSLPQLQRLELQNWSPLRVIETQSPLESIVYSPNQHVTLTEVENLASHSQLTRLCVSNIHGPGYLSPLLLLQQLQILEIRKCGTLPLPVLRPGELPQLRELHHLDSCKMDEGLPLLPEEGLDQAAASEMEERARDTMSSMLMLPGICKIVGNSYLLRMGLPQQMEGWNFSTFDKWDYGIFEIQEKMAHP